MTSPVSIPFARLGLRAFSVLVLVGMLAMVLGPAVVRADNISASYTVDATVNGMSLTVGGSTGSGFYVVTPTNGDGKNGCNLTGSTTVVISVSNSNPSVATIDVSQITFTSCGDTPSFVVTPVAGGNTTISLSQVSNNTDGSFNLLPATFTVYVSAAAVTNNAPVVTVTGVADGGAYTLGAVPTPGCWVDDVEDGSFAITPTSGGGTGIGPNSILCEYTDSGGLYGSASASYSVLYSYSCGRQILQPVNANGSSVFKKGSTVPVKFQVCDANGLSVGTAGVVTGFAVWQGDPSVAGSVNETAISTAADQAFRWDGTQWIFNLSTKSISYPAGTYFGVISLNDGTTIQFQFGLR